MDCKNIFLFLQSIFYNMKRYILIIAFLVSFSLSAQSVSEVDIISHITENGVNTVIQPAALNKYLKKTISATTTESQTDEDEASVSKDRNAGYRVQVFSDNRPAAKGEARAKGSNIAERFPAYRTYVKYTSPYWRLRVGDFRTRREAEDAAEAIKQAFPSYSREIRVVADRINIATSHE